MVTMMDEIFDRSYQDGRAQLNAGLARLFHRTGTAALTAFEVLNRIEFQAPWLELKRKGRRA
jgi:hypothetical protein